MALVTGVKDDQVAKAVAAATSAQAPTRPSEAPAPPTTATLSGAVQAAFAATGVTGQSGFDGSSPSGAGAAGPATLGDRELKQALRQAGATEAVKAQAEGDAQPWPAGPPESYVKTRFDPATMKVTHQEKIDTVLEVLPPEAQTGKGRVTEASLDKAFNAILDARKTPGAKTLELSWTPSETVT